MENKTTAKDFLLHFGGMILLYSGTGALIAILFRVINVAFPSVSRFGDYYSYGQGFSAISFPVATLLVVFPLFLFVTSTLNKAYLADPTRKDYAVRKWLLYITLFISGGILAGDLITVLYRFLDGQELTIAFLLKVLTVLVITSLIFGYYLDDLRGRLSDHRRNFWKFVAIFFAVGSIIAGFLVLGSPQTQRSLRYDSQRISDLQNIQARLVNYWQRKGVLPDSLFEMTDEISGLTVPKDPQTSLDYEYRKTGDMSFELCAEFKNASTPNDTRYDYYEYETMSNWKHNVGRHCFERTIDPELYPILKK